MIRWKYTDSTERVVFFQNKSCLVESEEIKAWLEVGNTPEPADVPPPPSEADIKAALIDAVQSHLDAGAQALGYDDIATACTYAGEASVPRFQNEGKALRAWRSYCWEHCQAVLDSVASGERAIPTEAELIAELPILVKT